LTVASYGWRRNGRWAWRTRARYPVGIPRRLPGAGRRAANGSARADRWRRRAPPGIPAPVARRTRHSCEGTRVRKRAVAAAALLLSSAAGAWGFVARTEAPRDAAHRRTPDATPPAPVL